MYKSIIRPLLFNFDPEKVHHFTAAALGAGFSLPVLPFLADAAWKIENPKLDRSLFGLKFPNPVGLAAGFDKDATMIDSMAHLGFGFTEIGTLTPKAQPGNPKPRLFRLPKDKAIINRMGFNNGGVVAASKRLEKRKSNIIVGGNIGKNKDTENENAVSDYLICLRQLHDLVDYFVVNVSSPNTPGLRALQDKEPLLKILLTLQEENQKRKFAKPLLLKIAPDLTQTQLEDIVELAVESKLSGIIATNTTISRTGLQTDAAEVE
ncbi:MAG: quinone-dependent dihydroorotate dehydrogenase, partial [Chitinophagaceae bacterium]